MIARFIDIGEISDDHCLSFPFIMFLYFYEADFVKGLIKKNEKKLSPLFNSMFCYVDDVLSLNNFKLDGHVDRIYSTV